MLIVLKVLAVMLLVLGNAFFVGSEIALTSARRSRIQQLADEGNASARLVQELHGEPERFYSVTQVGITLMSLALGAIGIATVTELLEPIFDYVTLHASWVVPEREAHYVATTIAHVLAFVIISSLHIVGGELAPKVYAFHRAVEVSIRVARLVNFLYRMFYWAIWALNSMSNALLRACGQRELTSPGGGHFHISEEELRTILVASEAQGIIDSRETAMIRGVFDLEEHTVGDVMVPRTRITGLTKDATIADALAVFREDRHHRYPVYDATVDNVVGILHAKQLLGSISEDITESGLRRPISEIILPAYVVPETKPLSDLLQEFRERRQQMAIVIDEHGGTAGVITLEDILEEIVGEYEDEFSARDRLIKRTKNSDAAMVDPSILLVDLEKALDISFHAGDYSTLTGFIHNHLKSVPEVGARIDLGVWQLIVAEMDGHRIVQVKLEKTEPSAETDTLASPDKEK